MSSSRLAALALGLLASACTTPLLDAPAKVRHDRVPLAPLFSPLFAYESSDDGTSWSWSTLLWLVGADQESDRGTSRVLPFWWHAHDPPYSETTLLFPLYYGRTAVQERWRFYSLLYGFTDSPEARADFVLGPVFHWRRSKTEDVWNSGLLFVYDWEHHGSRTDITLVPILGLAHLAQFELGYPPDGERVPALGRSASRRIELLNVFRFVTLFGYDDVGDRREIRLLTLLDSEVLSPLRSWRGRGDDPFVREWLFPLYMNVQDDDGGWMYVGPLWGRRHDTQAQWQTDWWLLGLFSRRREPAGTTWSVLGLPVVGP